MKGKIYQPPSCEEADHLHDGAPGHMGQQYVFRKWKAPVTGLQLHSHTTGTRACALGLM